MSVGNWPSSEGFSANLALVNFNSRSVNYLPMLNQAPVPDEDWCVAGRLRKGHAHMGNVILFSISEIVK